VGAVLAARESHDLALGQLAPALRRAQARPALKHDYERGRRFDDPSFDEPPLVGTPT
jgi:hypothetical protein